MAILDLNKRNVIAESRPENIENRKYITQEELGTSTLFSKDHSLDHISQYISGMKWTVTYFLQLRNMNDELVQLDPRIAATILGIPKTFIPSNKSFIDNSPPIVSYLYFVRLVGSFISIFQ